MANNIQAMFPVYLPKGKGENETEEDYKTGITENENNLQQNLNTLFNAVQDLQDLYTTLSQKG